MKFAYTITLLLFLTGLGMNQVLGQSAQEVLDQVGEGLIYGKSDAVARHFDDRVEITLLGDRKVHSKAQATYVLSEFFSDYKPVSFAFKHRGETNGTLYALGDLRCERGTFEVNIFVRTSPGARHVSEIRFEMK